MGMNKELQGKLDDQGLTEREIEVVELVAQGMSNKEVASELDVVEVTIKFHLKNVFRKLGINSRAKLIVMCLPYMVREEAPKLKIVKPVA